MGDRQICKMKLSVSIRLNLHIDSAATTWQSRPVATCEYTVRWQSVEIHPWEVKGQISSNN